MHFSWRGQNPDGRRIRRYQLAASVGFLMSASVAISYGIDLLSETPQSEFVIRSISARSVAVKGDGTDAPSVPLYRTQLLDNGGQPSVHAATLVNLPGGDIGAFWFGGSREGGMDVEIWFARYDQQTGKFSPARSVMSRQLLAEQLGRYIKKLGNPAAILDENGRVWLFFVSVSVGGWATSSINFITSDDGGKTWSSARRLVTSPFFNVSTLVRNPPVLLTDGGFALPVYHELAGKFAEILLVAPNGEIRNKTRVTWGRDALQPSLAAISESRGAVFMRYAGDPPMHMQFSSTRDAGRHFSRPRPLELPNADNSVAAAALPEANGFWIVYNSSETGRSALSIAVADRDVSMIVPIHDLESADSGEFSYPAITTDIHGHHHVAWTDNRQSIKHLVFDDNWLTQALDASWVILSP